MLPKPDERFSYVLAASDRDSFPCVLSDLFTEGTFALLGRGSPSNAILAVARAAESSAFLIEHRAVFSYSSLAMLRLSSQDKNKLRAGTLPESWHRALPGAKLVKAGGVFRVEERGMPLFYAAFVKNSCSASDSGAVAAAADRGGLEKLLSLPDKDRYGAPGGTAEGFSGYAEISLAELPSAPSPVKFYVSWKPGGKGKENGKAVWRCAGLDDLFGELLKHLPEPVSWDLNEGYEPAPVMLSAGFNLPPLKSLAKVFPRFRQTLAAFAGQLALSEDEFFELFGGRSVVSIGGENRVLWFRVPGVLLDLTADEKRAEKFVSAVWKELFFDVHPKALEGFEYGGYTSLPFASVAASSGNRVLLGAVSPESIKRRENVPFDCGGKALAWFFADLPRVGAALEDMSAMFSRLDSGGNGGFPGVPDTDEPFQPEISSPFDKSVARAFSKILKKTGRVAVVIESLERGWMTWGKSAGIE